VRRNAPVSSASAAACHLGAGHTDARESARERVLNTVRAHIGVALIEPQWPISATVERASTAPMRATARKDIILVSAHPGQREEKNDAVFAMPAHED
jgi:hypothetical protein